MSRTTTLTAAELARMERDGRKQIEVDGANVWTDEAREASARARAATAQANAASHKAPFGPGATKEAHQAAYDAHTKAAVAHQDAAKVNTGPVRSFHRAQMNRHAYVGDLHRDFVKH